METIRKKAMERRAEVMDAALDIIWERGIHALSMRLISEKVGVSEAALYRYFTDKAEIVTALVDLAFERGLDRNEAAAGSEWFLRSMEARLRGFEEDPRLVAVLFHEEVFRAYPEAGSRFDQRRHQMASRCAEEVREMQSAGLANDIDADTFALIYMGAMRMAVLEWERSGDRGPMGDKAAAIMRELDKLLR
jgi:AcrR family transcriptional regulator